MGELHITMEFSISRNELLYSYWPLARLRAQGAFLGNSSPLLGVEGVLAIQ